MQAQDLVPPKKAAQILRVHLSTVYRWVRRGQLPAYRCRSRYLVSRSEAERLAAELDAVTPVVPPPRLRRGG